MSITVVDRKIVEIIIHNSFYRNVSKTVHFVEREKEDRKASGLGSEKKYLSHIDKVKLQLVESFSR